MKRNILLVLVVVLSILFFSGCVDDSACDEAKSNAQAKCEDQGYEARNCRKTKDETHLFYRECVYSCECYESSYESYYDSAELIKTVSDSCIREDEGFSNSDAQKN